MWLAIEVFQDQESQVRVVVHMLQYASVWWYLVDRKMMFTVDGQYVALGCVEFHTAV